MPTPANWQTRRQRVSLIGEVCGKCGAKIFPPRDVCPSCSKPAFEPFAFGGKGEVYSFSTVYQAPSGFKSQEPYTVALVKLEEGPLVTAQLTDVDKEDVRIGMPVEMVTRKLTEHGPDGLIIYGYKFRPEMSEKTAG